MSTGKELLSMIEAVDPDDTAKLDEIAKPIPYPGAEGYRATLCGQIISLKRNKATVMKQQVGKKGYMCVCLRNAISNNSETHRVHRLIALAHLPNPERKPMVCHRDGNRTNNNASNLYWGTHQENMEDLLKHGSLKGSNNPKAQLKEEEVAALRIVYGMIPRGLRDRFANMFDVHPATIKRAISGATWSSAIAYERGEG